MFDKKLIEKIKGYFIKPGKTFAAEKRTNVKEALKYGFLGLLLRSILLTLLVSLGLSAGSLAVLGTGAVIVVFFFALIGGFISLLVNGLWLHLWAYILGARQGLMQTMKTVFYAHTPDYYLGWIPFVGFLTAIWTLGLEVFGLKELQKMNTRAAVMAVVLSVVILIIIVVAIIFALISIYGATVLASLSGMS